MFELYSLGGRETLNSNHVIPSQVQNDRVGKDSSSSSKAQVAYFWPNGNQQWTGHTFRLIRFTSKTLIIVLLNLSSANPIQLNIGYNCSVWSVQFSQIPLLSNCFIGSINPVLLHRPHKKPSTILWKIIKIKKILIFLVENVVRAIV